MRISILTLLTILLITTATAQKITTYKWAKSMSDDRFYSGMAIDNHGKILVSTLSHGVFSFNGKDFTPVKLGIGQTPDLQFADTKGNLWFSFDNNILKYDGKKTLILSGKQSGIKTSITTMAEDPHGRIYVGNDDGLYVFDGKRCNKIQLPGGDIYKYSVRAIAFSTDGRIALGLSTCLLLFENNTWKKYDTSNSKMSLDAVTAVKFSPQNELYIGYGGGFGNGGFSIFSHGKLTNYDKHNSNLPDQEVRTITFANNKAILLGTNNGVLIIKDIKHLNTWVAKLASANFTTVFECLVYKKDAWVVTSRGLVKIENI